MRMSCVARYQTTIRSPWSSARAFDYMADVRNFVDWDPSIRGVVQVVGVGGGVDTEFDIEVAHPGGSTTFRYRTTHYAPFTSLRLEARTRSLTSVDRIDVADDGSGCLVTYDAELDLNGPRTLFDPLLGWMFGRIGDRAARGLETMLEGARTER